MSLFVISLVSALLTVSWLWQRAVEKTQIAERAAAAREEQVYEASLAEARAIRFSGNPELYDESVAAIERAAELRRTTELRNEAIATLVTSRMRLRKQIGHKSRAKLQVSADFSQYAFADDDFSVVVMDVQSGKEIARHCPDPCGGSIQGVHLFGFSPDGRFLSYEVSLPGKLMATTVIDTLTGQAVATVDREPSWIDFAPDSSYLAYVRHGKELHFESLSGAEPPPTLRNDHAIRVFDVAPDKAILALTEVGESRVTLFGLSDGSKQTELELPAAGVGVCWSHQGDRVAVGCEDGSLTVWNSGSGERTHLLKGHFDTVQGFSFHPTQALLSSFAWGAQTIIWDLRTGRKQFEFDASTGVFSSDGRAYRTQVDYSNNIKLWDLLSSECLREISLGSKSIQTLTNLSISCDNRLLSIGHTQGTAVWDMDSGEELWRLPSGNTLAVQFHPRDLTLLTAGELGLMSWDLGAIARGQSKAVEPVKLLPRPSEGRPFTRIATDRTGTRATATDDWRSVRIVDLEKRMEIASISAAKHPGVTFVSLSPKGKHVATSTWKGVGIRIFDCDRGELLQELIPDKRNAKAQFGPKGELLATNTLREVTLWDTTTWEAKWSTEQGTTQAHISPLPVIFSPNGGLLACVVARGAIRLLRSSDGKEVATLVHPDRLDFESICFSPDGRQLVGLVGANASIQVWNLRAINERLAPLGLDWE